MKIIAGNWKGIRLDVPPKEIARPTQQRVKKSLFDILGEFIQEREVLDLFCGSGSLGIEALSRGAHSVTFVEWNPSCVKLLKENLKRLPGRKEVFCLKENALKAIRKFFREKKRFDLVFLDPPYNKEVMTKCLREIGKCDILTPHAILVIRHPKGALLPFQSGLLRLKRQKRYGETALSFYGKS